MDNALDKLLLPFLQKVDESLISRKYIKEFLIGDAERIANEKEYTEMKSKFHLMGEDFIKQGLIHSYEIIEANPNSEIGGMRLKDKNNNILISLDVKMLHLYFGVHTNTLKITLADSYHADVERLLSNKLLAAISKVDKDVKDLYAIYLLTEYLDIDSEQHLFNKLPLTEEDLINYMHTWKQDTTLKTFDFRKSLERLYYLLASNNQDEEIKTKAVICGDHALEESGLLYYNPGARLDIFTKYKELDNLYLSVISYHYNPNIDYTNFVKPLKSNNNLLVPSMERAIIECIKFIDTVSEGSLIEVLKDYQLWYKNYDKLYAMAAFYQVSKEDLDYWIYEAENDYEDWWCYDRRFKRFIKEFMDNLTNLR